MANNPPTMRTESPLPAGVQLGPIVADHVYPLKVFRSLTGLGGWALRKAQRDGLRVVTVGRCKFVRGADFMTYLASVESTQTDS